MCGKMPSLLLNRPLPEFRRLSPQINQPFPTMATLLQHAKTLPATFSCYQKIPPTAKIPVNFKIPTKLAIAVRWLIRSNLSQLASWGYFAFATFLGNEVRILSLTTSLKRGSPQCYDGLTPSRARHGNTLSLRSAFFLKVMSVLFPERKVSPTPTLFSFCYGLSSQLWNTLSLCALVYFFSPFVKMFWQVWQRVLLSRANLIGQNGM